MKRAPVVFIDTMTLIWWIQKAASQGQEQMVKRAQWLAEDLQERQADRVVSTVSVAEFLRGLNEAERAKQYAIIEETFICRPFDAVASHVAAKVYQKQVTIKEYENRKAVLRADELILATALASRADVLYTHDDGLRKLSEKNGLEARDLPDVPPRLDFT
ncbi:MAG: PIN domain-containing protein [Phycisphaerae bacterium]|nr:PIN domain-containing protein [Phycisphaerae bacterium]